MERKLVAIAIAGFFSFILITTAWDYCPPAGEAGRPDPDTLLFKGYSVSQAHQLKKPHQPCASLKDAYDVFVAFNVHSGNVQHFFKDLSPVFPTISFAGNFSDFHGLSPPFENDPPLDLPIFLLYRNLRL